MLVGAAVTWPLTARAQQLQRTRRIGVGLNFQENDPDGYARMGAFRQALQEAGWDEYRNLKIEYGFSLGSAERSRANVRELLLLSPDLILRPATRPSLRCAGRQRPPFYSWQL